METCKQCGSDGFTVTQRERKTSDWYTGEMEERTFASYRTCRSCGVIDKYRCTSINADGDVTVIPKGEEQ